MEEGKKALPRICDADGRLALPAPCLARFAVISASLSN
jgi:hypothetical protein